MNNCKVAESSVCHALLHHLIPTYRTCARIFLQLFSLPFVNFSLFSIFVQDRYHQLPLWQPVSGITFDLSCKVLPSSSCQSPDWMLSIAYQASSSFPVRLCSSTTNLIYFQCPFPVPSAHTVLFKVNFCFSPNPICLSSLFFFGWKALISKSICWNPTHLFKGGIVTGRHS